MCIYIYIYIYIYWSFQGHVLHLALEAQLLQNSRAATFIGAATTATTNHLKTSYSNSYIGMSRYAYMVCGQMRCTQMTNAVVQ